MIEAICKTCGVVYIVKEKLPSNIECLCKEKNFKLVKKQLIENN